MADCWVCQDERFISVRLTRNDVYWESCPVCRHDPLFRDTRPVGRPVRAEGPAIRPEGEAVAVAAGKWEREFVDLGGEGGGA